MTKQRLPSLGVDVKASQVAQFYAYLGMKLDSVEACKYSQTAGEDTVRVAMDFEPVVDLRDDANDEPDRTIEISTGILSTSRNTTMLRIKGWDSIEDFMRARVGWEITKVSPVLTKPDSSEECLAWISSPKEEQTLPEQLMTLEEQHEFIELMKARKQLIQDQYDRCAEMVFEMVERRLRSQQAESPAEGSTG